MQGSQPLSRRACRFLVRSQPERLLAVVIAAFALCSLVALWFTSPVHSDTDDSWRAFDRALSAADDRTEATSADSQGTRTRALRASSREGGSGVEAATLKALSAVEQRLTALDSRLAAAEHNSASLSVAPPQPAVATPVAAVDGQVSAQVAALSQTVAAVLSLVAAEHQRAQVLPLPVPPAPPPPPPPPPPVVVESRGPDQKLEEWRHTVEEMVKKEAKEQVESETKKLKDTIKSLTHQQTDRYSQVLKELNLLSPDATSSAPLDWETGVSGATTPSPEQAAGHACRSPPCSREESCKYNDNCCADRMYEMLVDFSTFLKSRNVTHFVAAGTLIGAVRDKDIIPYTADVDMVIPREGWDAARSINFIKGRKRSYYFMNDPHEPHCARLCAVWEGLPVNRASFTTHFDWDTDKLGADVQYYMDIYDEDMDFAKHLKHLSYPLSTVTIRNHTFPAPSEAELWVEAKYGPSWRTPDHKTHGENIYPTLEMAEKWSKSMLSLRKVRTDAGLAHRMLERAHVDHTTGNIVLDDSGNDQVPDVEAKQVFLEGLIVSSEGNVRNGSLVIVPPDANEGEIVDYIIHWASEHVRGWDFELEKIGEQLLKVSRCSTGGDPFKACAKHGLPMTVALPWNSSIPKEATHLMVSAANENGVSSRKTGVGLVNDRVGSDVMFSRRAMIGIFGGLAPDSPKLASCVGGTAAFLHHDGQPEPGDAPSTKLLSGKEMEDRVVQLMIRKTVLDMKAALRVLSEWLRPVVDTLDTCGLREPAAKAAHDSLVRALGHLVAPKDFNYKPGQALDIDGTTIFLGINHAIGELRKDKPASFGMALGELLKPLGVAQAEKSFETQEDKHYHIPEAEFLPGRSGLRQLQSRVKYLRVSVKTAHDAHIALMQHEVKPGIVPDNTSVLYEFLLGGSLNRLCSLRFSRSGKNEVEVPLENVLDAEQFRDFWVSADTSTGRVALGRGHDISADVIFNITDTPPGVRGTPLSFAVMTPASNGAWRFPEDKDDDDVGELVLPGKETEKAKDPKLVADAEQSSKKTSSGSSHQEFSTTTGKVSESSTPTDDPALLPGSLARPETDVESSTSRLRLHSVSSE